MGFIWFKQECPLCRSKVCGTDHIWDLFLFDVSSKEIQDVNEAYENLSKEEKETLAGLQEQLKKAMRAKLRAEN